MSEEAEQFFNAVKAGSFETVCHMISENEQLLHVRDEVNLTPLHYAAGSQHVSAVSIAKYLLEHAATNQRMSATEIGNNLIKYLPENQGYVGACIAKKIIKGGLDSSSIDNSHSTPLHYAVQSGSVDMVRLLLEHGADKEKENIYEDTPEKLAKNRGNSGVIALLTGTCVESDTVTRSSRTDSDSSHPNPSLEGRRGYRWAGQVGGGTCRSAGHRRSQSVPEEGSLYEGKASTRGAFRHSTSPTGR